MIQKKICMLGSFAVGKTSLVVRYVHSIFSEKYHTTVGVKVDRKRMLLDGREVNLMLWDIHGEDTFQQISRSYLRGTSGYLLVADGTRPATLEQALGIREMVQETVGDIPFLLLLNKVDLVDAWCIGESQLVELYHRYGDVQKTSAKTGEGVEEAFLRLTQKLLQHDT